jgi:hypothetical protein
MVDVSLRERDLEKTDKFPMVVQPQTTWVASTASSRHRHSTFELHDHYSLGVAVYTNVNHAMISWILKSAINQVVTLSDRDDRRPVLLINTVFHDPSYDHRNDPSYKRW